MSRLLQLTHRNLQAKTMKTRSLIGSLLDEINGLDAEKKYTASALPRILFAEDIAKFTGLTLASVHHYTGNKKTHGHKLPRWFKLNRRLMWLESDVMEFLAQAQQAAADDAKRPRGRPNKIEQVRRAALIDAQEKN